MTAIRRLTEIPGIAAANRTRYRLAAYVGPECGREGLHDNLETELVSFGNVH